MSDDTELRLGQGAVQRLCQPDQLARLSEFAAAGLHERERFDPEIWLAVAEAEPVARETVRELAHGGWWVDRSELFRYARQALNTGRGDEAIRLFTICQVWGIARTGGHRALADTRKALGSARLRDHLARGIEQLTTGRAGSFYQENRSPRLRGWGPSFATTFAYAVTTAHAQQGAGDPAFPRALILDDHVWRALNETLDWSSLRAAGTRRWAQRYTAYVVAVHSWAGELRRHEPRTTAHTVERLLFQLGAAAPAGTIDPQPAADDALAGLP